MNWHELVWFESSVNPLIYIAVIKIHVMHAISFEDPLIYDISIRKQIRTFGDSTHMHTSTNESMKYGSAIISYQSQSRDLYAKKCLIGIGNSYECAADKTFRTFYAPSFDCIECFITLYGRDVASVRLYVHTFRVSMNRVGVLLCSQQ